MSTDTEIMSDMAKAMQQKDRQREERGIPDASRETGLRFEAKTKGASGPEVPGRTRAWRTDDGREVWLPTVTLMQHLRKVRPNGESVFTLEKPRMAERVPLDIVCSVCVRVNGQSRKFYSEDQYENHMEILHPREWAREMRERDRAERQEERAVLRTLIQRGEGNAEVVQAYTCEVCGRGFTARIAYTNHKKTHDAA